MRFAVVRYLGVGPSLLRWLRTLYDIVSLAAVWRGTRTPGRENLSQMKSVRACVMSLVVIAICMAAANMTACSIMHTPVPTPPPDFTPRPTPGGGANTIDVTATDFVQHSLTVKRGSEVTFVVRLDSGPHILCLGKNGHCDPSLPGPRELSEDGGFSVDAGQSLTVDFISRGVYPITDPIYPGMNTVITVT